MAEPTGVMTISFSVSATPRVALAANDGFYQSQTVIHENVRTSVGGSGEITAGDLTVNSAWSNGGNTAVTSNDGMPSTIDASTDMLVIKHTGNLVGTTTAAAAADTVLVKSASNVIAELKSGEAIVLPRPQSDIDIASGSGNHVDVEVTILGGE